MKGKLPLKPTLVSCVLASIILTALAIGIPGYFRAKDAIVALWGDLSGQIVRGTMLRTSRFLDSAKPTLDTLEQLVQDGDIKLTDEMQVLDATYAFVEANPHLEAAYFTKPDGTFIITYLIANTLKPLSSIRVIDPDGKTHFRNFVRAKDNSWTTVEEYTDVYDPRKRPFWEVGSKSLQGAWTAPYMDFIAQKPAISFAKAQYLKDKFMGVWTVDFFIDTLNHYLSDITSKTHADIYLIADDGTMIASSNATLGQLTSINKVTSQDPKVQEAWNKAAMLPNKVGQIPFKDYFAYIEHFPSQMELPWNILTIIPTDYYLGPINHQRLISVIFSIILCIIFALIALTLFGHISTRLNEIAGELQSLEEFRFTEIDFSNKHALIREVDTMCNATSRMKSGLLGFSKYVPIDLVRELIKTGQEPTLSGQKREITVLFTDLANFTQLAETLSPDALLTQLGEYFEAMGECLEKHKGTVDKYIGDSIMALWGAPTPLEKHALFACEAALAMREKLNQLWEKWKKENKPLLTQRIGINTGQMVVGNIGSSNHMQYTAIGDAVNLASRLEGLSKFYGTQILLGEETAKMVQESLIVRPIDWVYVKGKSQPTLFYELLGTKSEVAPIIQQGIEIYAKGLDAYRGRDFKTAIDRFQEARDKLGESDKVCEIMIAKGRNFLQNPPPDNWDGVTHMIEK